MTFEEIRQELFRLNDLRDKAGTTDYMRINILKPITEPEKPGELAQIMGVFNLEPVTWDEVKREVAAFEERMARETGFGVTYWTYQRRGKEIAGTYVLTPTPEEKGDG